MQKLKRADNSDLCLYIFLEMLIRIIFLKRGLHFLVL